MPDEDNTPDTENATDPAASVDNAEPVSAADAVGDPTAANPASPPEDTQPDTLEGEGEDESAEEIDGTNLEGAVTLDALGDALEKAARDGLRPLLEGAERDLQNYAKDIARNITQVITLPEERRQAVLDELQGQASALLEQHRLRARAQAWQTVQKVLEVLARAAATMAVTAL